MLLAVALGSYGVHNFFAGYTKRGVTQLVVSIFTCFISAIPMWIWAIVEACTVEQDANGVRFK